MKLGLPLAFWERFVHTANSLPIEETPQDSKLWNEVFYIDKSPDKRTLASGRKIKIFICTSETSKACRTWKPEDRSRFLSRCVLCAKYPKIILGPMFQWPKWTCTSLTPFLTRTTLSLAKIKNKSKSGSLALQGWKSLCISWLIFVCINWLFTVESD